MYTVLFEASRICETVTERATCTGPAASRALAPARRGSRVESDVYGEHAFSAAGRYVTALRQVPLPRSVDVAGVNTHSSSTDATSTEQFLLSPHWVIFILPYILGG